jgi:hypothetical protein
VAYTFYVCEFVSGKLLDELPLEISSELTRVLSGAGAGAFKLDTSDPRCPDNWDGLLQPWRSLILAVDPSGRIAWHGIPTTREHTLGAVKVIPCVTTEGYLARRYVPTLSYSRKDQTSVIAKGLVQSTDTGGAGFAYDCAASGVLRDHAYASSEDARVLARLQELGALQNGFEWTVDVAWTDSTQTAVSKTFRTGYPTLGVITTTPDHVYEAPGAIVDLTYQEDWKDGAAATHATVTGSGQGPQRLASAPSIDTMREGQGWPRLEERKSDSSVISQSVLDSAAVTLGNRLFGGQQVTTLQARADMAPFLGEIGLGDSARVAVKTASLNLDSLFRIVGWALSTDATTYKPTIARMGA